MQRAPYSYPSPDLQSTVNNPQRVLPKGRITDSIGTSPSRGMRIGKCEDEKQEALQRELDALGDDVLLQEYEEPIYKQDPMQNTNYSVRNEWHALW